MGPELIAIATIVSAVSGAVVDTALFGKQIVQIAKWLKNRPSPAEQRLAKLQALVSVMHQRLLGGLLTVGLLSIVAVVGATFATGNIGPERDGADLGIGAGGAAAVILGRRLKLKRPIVSADEAAIIDAYETAYSTYLQEEKAKLKILNEIEVHVLNALVPDEDEAKDTQTILQAVQVTFKAAAQEIGMKWQESITTKEIETALTFLKKAEYVSLSSSSTRRYRQGLGSSRLASADVAKLKVYRTDTGTEKLKEYSVVLPSALPPLRS